MTKRVVVVVALAATIGACGGKSKSADSRVRAEVERLEQRNAELEIRRASLAEIPGIELFGVTVMVPDHPGYRCVVHGDQVWCTGDERLTKAIEASGLAAKPDQLDDATWIELAAFLLDATPLKSAGKANLLEDYAPAAARAQITAPAVTRTDAGIAISFFVERVSYMGYPSGPMQLTHITVRVTASGTKLDTDAVWDSTESGTIDDIGTDTSACDPLVAAIVAASEAGARCTEDAECAIREVELCNVDGLGCYWVAHSSSLPSEPLDEAIAAYVSGCGVMSKCDCAGPPTTAVCRDGACTPTP